MGIARMQAHVEAPIEVVFDYAVDFKHTPEWNVMVVDMTADAPMAKVGDRFQATVKSVGRTYTSGGQITEIERPRLIAFTSMSPAGSHQNWTIHLTPAGTGTDLETIIDYEVPMGLLGASTDKAFFERMVQRSLEQSLDNFVALVEHKVLQPV